MSKRVWVQEWEESEAGWGCRFDGYSVHLSEQDAKKYVENYWNSMPTEIPDVYSRPCGRPFFAIAPDEIGENLLASKLKDSATWVHESNTDWIKKRT